jgi:acyl transferase domain-containing protein
LRHPDEAIDDAAYFLGARARLWAAGVEACASPPSCPPAFRHLPLPTYAFRRQRYWVKPTPTAAGTRAATAAPADRIVNDVVPLIWQPTGDRNVNLLRSRYILLLNDNRQA